MNMEDIRDLNRYYRNFHKWLLTRKQENVTSEDGCSARYTFDFISCTRDFECVKTVCHVAMRNPPPVSLIRFHVSERFCKHCSLKDSFSLQFVAIKTFCAPSASRSLQVRANFAWVKLLFFISILEYFQSAVRGESNEIGDRHGKNLSITGEGKIYQALRLQTMHNS